MITAVDPPIVWQAATAAPHIYERDLSSYVTDDDVAVVISIANYTGGGTPYVGAWHTSISTLRQPVQSNTTINRIVWLDSLNKIKYSTTDPTETDFKLLATLTADTLETFNSFPEDYDIAPILGCQSTDYTSEIPTDSSVIAALLHSTINTTAELTYTYDDAASSCSGPVYVAKNNHSTVAVPMDVDDVVYWEQFRGTFFKQGIGLDGFLKTGTCELNTDTVTPVGTTVNAWNELETIPSEYTGAIYWVEPWGEYSGNISFTTGLRPSGSTSDLYKSLCRAETFSGTPKYHSGIPFYVAAGVDNKVEYFLPSDMFSTQHYAIRRVAYIGGTSIVPVEASFTQLLNCGMSVYPGDGVSGYIEAVDPPITWNPNLTSSNVWEEISLAPYVKEDTVAVYIVVEQDSNGVDIGLGHTDISWESTSWNNLVRLAPGCATSAIVWLDDLDRINTYADMANPSENVPGNSSLITFKLEALLTENDIKEWASFPEMMDYPTFLEECGTLDFTSEIGELSNILAPVYSLSVHYGTLYSFDLNAAGCTNPRRKGIWENSPIITSMDSNNKIYHKAYDTLTGVGYPILNGFIPTSTGELNIETVTPLESVNDSWNELEVLSPGYTAALYWIENTGTGDIIFDFGLRPKGSTSDLFKNSFRLERWTANPNIPIGLSLMGVAGSERKVSYYKGWTTSDLVIKRLAFLGKPTVWTYDYASFNQTLGCTLNSLPLVDFGTTISENIDASSNYSSNAILNNIIVELSNIDEDLKFMFPKDILDGFTLDEQLTNILKHIESTVDVLNMSTIEFDILKGNTVLLDNIGIQDYSGILLLQAILEHVVATTSYDTSALFKILSQDTINILDNHLLSISIIAEDGLEIGESLTPNYISNILVTDRAQFLVDLEFDDGIYSGWVINPENYAVSNYDFKFNSTAPFYDKYLLTDKSGLYELGGTLDESDQISASLTTAALDFESDSDKQVPQVLLGISGDNIILKVLVDGKHTTYYTLNSSSSNLNTKQIKIGKGLIGKTWQFNLQTTEDMSLSSLDFYPVILKRKH